MERITRREALLRVGYLMGGALAAPTLAGVLGGCRAETAGEWTPAVFSTDQARLVTAVTGELIPETDTPGAVGAGVPQFIDRMMAEWYPDDLRQRFLDGLAALDRRAVDTTGSSFVDLAMDQKRELLASIDREEMSAADDFENPAGDPGADVYDATDSTAAVQRSSLSDDIKRKVDRQIQEAARRVSARRQDGGPVVRADLIHEGSTIGDPSFYRMLKELTLVGYYTSEVGATQELNFVQVPGRWDSCVPFSEVGRTWAI